MKDFIGRGDPLLAFVRSVNHSSVVHDIGATNNGRTDTTHGLLVEVRP